MNTVTIMSGESLTRMLVKTMRRDYELKRKAPDVATEMEELPTENRKNDEARLSWFREAKFGMMIHWGLYAELAGEWEGEEIPFLGEWIMQFANISIEQYEKIAERFNPVEFNADAWVRLARDAGMRYITITSKHHEGFAMYHSEASNYNIVDATPFKRDPLRELADACHQHDIKLCFYYSHGIDFHHPHAFRNDKFHPERGERNYSVYMKEKGLPQLRELLTKYGDIAMIWFDMPEQISLEHAQQYKNLVLELQPECIIGGRLGHGLEDFLSMGDNEIPEKVHSFPWETVATINNTWGYKKNDHDWKSTAGLIRLLISVVSKGGNYTLNVGPTSTGIISLLQVENDYGG